MPPETGTEYRNMGSIKHGTNSGTHTAMEAAGLCFTMALRSVDSHTRASPMREKLSKHCTKTHTPQQHLAVLCTLLHHCYSTAKIKGRPVGACEHSVNTFSAENSTRPFKKGTPRAKCSAMCPILFPTLQLSMYQKLLLALFILLIHASGWFTQRGKSLSLPRILCSALRSLHFADFNVTVEGVINICR